MKSQLGVTAALILLAGPFALASDPDPEALRKAGHWKQIRAIVEPLYRGNPGDLRQLYWMARVKVAFGDLQSGYELAKKLVAASPGNADHQFALAEAVAGLARRAGLLKALSYRGEFRHAVEKALAINPRHAEALNMNALFYLNAPFIAGGNTNRGLANIRSLAQVDPALACLAEVIHALNQKDWARAETLLKQAAANDPKSYPIQARLAGLYLNAEPKRLAEAVQYASSAVAIEPGRVAAYTTLARAYATSENWAQLDATLSQAEQHVPDNLAPCFHAARVLLAAGRDLPRAERYLRKYLSREPEAESPDIATAHWRLGLVLEKLGRKADAVVELEAAVRLRPDLDEAVKDLKRMR